MKNVKDYAITLDELPAGYSIHNEEFNKNGENMSIDVQVEESYKAYYWHSSDPENTSSEPLYPVFHLFILKCENNNNASKYINEFYKINESDNDTLDITPIELPKIGDESDYKLYQTESFMGSKANLTISFLGFRVENIFVSFMTIKSENIDVDITTYSYDIANIVKNKIEEDYK